MDERFTALSAWVKNMLGSRAGSLDAASQDASFRRFFRVRHGDGTLIAIDAPPEHEDLPAYLRVGGRLRALGLNVPQVYYQDTRRGFALVADLGTRLYLQALTPQRVERLYGDALGALVTLQTGGLDEPGFLPAYNRELLTSELELFSVWYVERHLQVRAHARRRPAFATATEVLVTNALAQPQVWVHRDYHSRNLLVCPRHNPGIIDFQDAVLGPVTYDLASLLRDCYVRWSTEQVTDWAKGYFALARQSGVPVGEDENQFLRWFDLMGVQRHLKAIGIFARLRHRDAKSGFVRDIPRVLTYIREVCERYPELQPLHRLLSELPPWTP